MRFAELIQKTKAPVIDEPQGIFKAYDNASRLWKYIHGVIVPRSFGYSALL